MKRKYPALPDEETDDPLINLTPLIDVVFVVLITFMMIAPVLDTDLVQLASSSSEQYKPKEGAQTSLSITVREDNSIWVDGKQIALSELKPWLKRERVRSPKAVPKLIHDKRAQFGTYQALKNVLEESGFEEMELVLKPS